MTPERWQIVKDVLATALEQPPSERDSYLKIRCVDDVSLRRDVDALLADEQKISTEFLVEEQLASTAAVALGEDTSPLIGRQVGAYKIVERIGIGGMGEVYRAFRADDQYQKNVALKLVRGGLDSASVMRQFRTERQILAGLEHTNIARLLDGGTTEDGIPFFVMELVEGEPLAQYCDRYQLSVAARLELFLQVCAAIQYAHQRLIIHRDIKPGNILVTEEGVPKLLDFGIAKILGASSITSDLTLTAFRVLTPRYASPEQIQGKPMTTSSDVYSLGVVLYELLTGQSPYRLGNKTPQETANAACQVEPQKPSSAVRVAGADEGRESSSVEFLKRSMIRSSSERLRKRLRGDLDNIVLMALRKEPERRYASVEQFSTDIRRHLGKLPVFARKDTLRYRFLKFVTRHKGVVAVSVVAILSLLTGMAVALHEARVARQERMRAERRFNDVRKLAHSLMFDVHDSIRDLPGTTSARKLLVEKALEYLDSLSREATGDEALQQELAAAYDRIGDLLGYNGSANLGDFKGALESYNKALVIREAAAAAHPEDLRAQYALLDEYFRQSYVLQDAADYQQALAVLRKGLPRAQELSTKYPDVRLRDYWAGFYWQTGNLLAHTGSFQPALESYRSAASIRESLVLLPNTNDLIRSHLAADYAGVAKMLHHSGDIDGALQTAQKSIQILEQLSASNPRNTMSHEFLGEAYLITIPLYEDRREYGQGLEFSQKAKRLFEQLVAADPSNHLARNNLGFSNIELGRALILQKKISEAVPPIKAAIDVFDSAKPKNRYDVEGQATAYQLLGMVHVSLAEREPVPSKKISEFREAETWFRRSLHTRDEENGGKFMDYEQRTERDNVTRQLAKCESALNRLQP